MAFFLGIDGGGSKSTAAVSDGSSVLATYTAEGCNLNTVSREEARRALGLAVHGALSLAEIPPANIVSACAGVAGAATPENAVTISEILSELLPCASIQVVGDTVVALESFFPGEAGVVCISGTGSVALGRNERGELARAGGWGRLVSDEGSGNWIGHRAVSQCLRALDMGRSSSLITGIMEHWRIVTREQLVQRCNREQFPSFAELFPVVLAASESGDALASEILTSAGIELARIAQVVLRRLWIGHTRLEIVTAGGVFANSARIRRVFGNFIRTDRPEVIVRLSQRQPFEGALYLARQGMADNDRAVS
jgi:glucosamine kinase